jgi:para-nitrobenzyl esterase
VRAEIAAFGGDPSQVTAMGQSAGANSLAALLALPAATELFDRAILQSGPLSGHPQKKAARMSQAIAKRLGIAATREAFAAIPPERLVAEQSAVVAGGSPLSSGPAVAIAVGEPGEPVDPLAALMAGAGRGIPVLIGATEEEYRLWLVPSGMVDRVTALTLTLARLSSRVPAKVVKAHRRRRPDARPGEVLGEVITDMLMRGPLTRFADSRLGTRAHTWVYEFRWRSPVDRLGSAHVMDLGFVFDRAAEPDAVALAGENAPQALADAMHGAWVRFIMTGDPGWEEWSARQPVQVFDADGGHIDYAPRADELDGLPEG